MSKKRTAELDWSAPFIYVESTKELKRRLVIRWELMPTTELKDWAGLWNLELSDWKKEPQQDVFKPLQLGRFEVGLPGE
jgi:hypothetical protein